MRIVSLLATLALLAASAFAQADKKTTAPAADTKKKAEDVKKKVEPKAAEKKATEKKAAAPAAPVNINTASKTALMTLPGVGEANADHIIKGRPYKSVNELVSRKIVQQRYFDEFKGMVTVK